MKPCLTVLLWACTAQLFAAETDPTVRVRDIPEGLKMVWRPIGLASNQAGDERQQPLRSRF